MTPFRNARDHYHPALHLRHFTDANGVLWAHDRTNITAPFRQIAPNVGFEKGLYTILDPADGNAAAFEAWLAHKVDGPAANALESAASAPALGPPERSALSAFIAAQDLRTPRARERVLALYRAGLRRQWADWRSRPQELADAIANDSGTRYTTEQVLEMLEEHDFDVSTNAWLDFFGGMVNKIARRLFNMRWLRAYAPDEVPFITSDVGIVKCRGGADSFVEWDMGFIDGRDIWVFPVKPDVAVVIAAGDGPGMSGPSNPKWARAVNCGTTRTGGSSRVSNSHQAAQRPKPALAAGWAPVLLGYRTPGV